MINVFKELIYTAASGRHTGKGLKLSRIGQYKKALKHFELAIKYSEKGGAVPNPAIIENLARTHARLGDFISALSLAKKASDLYEQLELSNATMAESKSRVERLITVLRGGNKDDINTVLTA